MAKTLLKKMFFKTTYTAAILHTPDDMRQELQLPISIDHSLSGSYEFILAFFSKKEALEKEMIHIKEALNETGLLWIAYPKAKALGTDLNRDMLHQTMEQYSCDGVSLVSLNDTWSAMRFKKRRE